MNKFIKTKYRKKWSLMIILPIIVFSAFSMKIQNLNHKENNINPSEFDKELCNKRNKFIEMRSPSEKGVGGLTILESIPLPPSPRGNEAMQRIIAPYNIEGLINFLHRTQVSQSQNKFSNNWIQKAIDSCAAKGGGIVRLKEGIHISGSLEMKSKVTLQLDKGAILQGSDKYTDYLNDAFIFGKDLTDISIVGEGTIDGVDCYNPKGEEGFRGPHCIRLINCKNIAIKGITIKNSANWAINCSYCSYATVENVIIRAGHDGLHTRFCDHFTSKNCDFRTGDDAFAGNDNQDFHISGCKLNSSCNIFRLGCLNLVIEDCIIWGPGEFMHRIRKVAKLPTVFTHFSPDDENAKLVSGNWLIKNLTVIGAEHFYMYNFENGLWQTGQPATSMRFENIHATGLLHGFNIIGDKKRKFDLEIKNSSFVFSDSTILDTFEFENVQFNSPAFINAQNFNNICLKDIEYHRKSSNPLLICKKGNKLNISNVKNIGGVELKPNKIEKVSDLKIK